MQSGHSPCRSLLQRRLQNGLTCARLALVLGKKCSPPPPQTAMSRANRFQLPRYVWRLIQSLPLGRLPNKVRARLVVGASGGIGFQLVRQLLAMPTVSKVYATVRSRDARPNLLDLAANESPECRTPTQLMTRFRWPRRSGGPKRGRQRSDQFLAPEIERLNLSSKTGIRWTLTTSRPRDGPIPAKARDRRQGQDSEHECPTGRRGGRSRDIRARAGKCALAGATT